MAWTTCRLKQRIVRMQYHGVIKEERYSVCDSKGKFLLHFTPDEATKDMSHAKIVATRIMNG